MLTVRKMRKCSGFTLVELLIVIIIIGILAGAMLLVAGSGTDSAEATKIISDLRSVKSAALLAYADNPSSSTIPAVASLDKYMDRAVTGITADGATVAGEWWYGHTDTKTAGVREKLKDRASEAGLYNGAAASPVPYDGTADGVYMKAR